MPPDLVPIAVLPSGQGYRSGWGVYRVTGPSDLARWYMEGHHDLDPKRSWNEIVNEVRVDVDPDYEGQSLEPGAANFVVLDDQHRPRRLIRVWPQGPDRPEPVAVVSPLRSYDDSGWVGGVTPSTQLTLWLFVRFSAPLDSLQETLRVADRLGMGRIDRSQFDALVPVQPEALEVSDLLGTPSPVTGPVDQFLEWWEQVRRP